MDVGGTFTDCLARDPQGNYLRRKVLSHGAWRSSGSVELQTARVMLPHKPDFPGELLIGYSLRWLHSAHFSEEKIIDWEPDTCSYLLDKAFTETIEAAEFEVFSGEESPLLAARLLTGTRLYEPLPPIRMRLGTTRGTNALLERKGARMAFITNQGLGDLLDIGDQQRPDLFALHIRKPQPLHALSLEISARMDAQGNTIHELEEAEVAAIVEKIKASGVESVAIALMHSYRNDAHEQHLARQLKEVGIAFVSVSSELAPVIKLLDRARSAAVDAYLSPLLDQYFTSIARPLGEGVLEVMTSAGTIMPVAHFRAKDSLLSGPAGGVAGAAFVARQARVPRFLSLDMGGTSADVARWNGEIVYQYETLVGDARLFSPAVAVHTVAAGGGSICAFEGSRLVVGPGSAGGHPGPACYGAGGPLTLTDVNLLLGRLHPEGFPIPINPAFAEEKLAQIVLASGLTREELLHGWLRIANEIMVQAIREISVSQGFDPAEYALMAFGGAGGVHATAVAGLLGIKQVIASYDAGLLSALGISKAREERLVRKQILQPLATFAVDENHFEPWKKEAADLLFAETGVRAATFRTTLFLRIAGQDAALEIPWNGPLDDLNHHFQEAYVAIFNHWIPDREIEVVAAQLIARGPEPEIIPLKSNWTPFSPTSFAQTAFGPLFAWEALDPGAEIAGPAVIAGKFSTLVVEAGWVLRTGEDRLLQIFQVKNALTAPEETPALITRELFLNRFRHVANEMGVLLERTSFSVNVKERLDFSCALLDAAGRLVANAPHIPVHLGSLGVCVRKVREALLLDPGDVILTNHPAFGGSHLPDLTLIQGVFDEKNTLIGHVANRAHHAELGGKKPGSMPTDARNLAEEGIVLPPMYLIRKGIGQWEEVEKLFTLGKYPTRAWAENRADLLAGLASLQAGVKGLQSLCAQYGSAVVTRNMDDLRIFSRNKTLEALATHLQNPVEAVQYLDDGTPIRVHLEIKDDKLQIDFAGTAPVHPGNFNANPSIVSSVVMYVLRLLLRENLPMNEGILEATALRIPEGLLNPRFSADPEQCPAVVGGNVETSQQIAELLIQAFGLIAGNQGTMNNLVFGNENFGCYETIGGGAGAGNGFAGASGVQVHMTNTRITDPEILEYRYPVRMHTFAFRKNSGGKGQWNGGDGLIREIEFLKPVSVTLLTQRRHAGAPGAHGGADGLPGRQFRTTSEGESIALPGVYGYEAAAHERIRIETPGGGGWGVADQ